MQMGILGFPKSGKTTLFNLLTRSERQTDKFAASAKTHMAVAAVPDPRLEKLRDHYNPRRYTPATVEYIDIPGVKKGEGAEGLDLARLRDADALMHVVRAFEDPEILHPEGSVDARRDIEHLELELIVADLEQVERRLERLVRAAKGGLSGDDERERALLADVVQPALAAERPLREVEIEPADEKRLRGFQLLSAKPLLTAINVDEAALGSVAAADYATPGRPAIVVSAPIEAEIAQLDGDEQSDFLAEIGMAEPSVDRILRASYELLGLISFFTVGEDEVRAWTIRDGTNARKAASAIHSDLERGFIRAEVVAWDDLLRLGSMSACRDEGLLRLEGKEYLPRDGEIMHIRSGV